MFQRKSFGIILVILALVAVPAPASLTIGFDQSTYEAQPGQPFQVQVHLDADPNTPGNQPVAAGLYSMGVRVYGNDSLGFYTLGTDSIVVPPELDCDGFDGPAEKASDLGSLGALGVLPSEATEGYDGTLLMTVTLVPDSSTGHGGFYSTLTLGEFFQNPSYDDFLDFACNSLDSQLEFGTAVVHVVPEPSGLFLILIALLSFARFGRRRRRKTLA